jgi:hypothetical protein
MAGTVGVGTRNPNACPDVSKLAVRMKDSICVVWSQTMMADSSAMRAYDAGLGSITAHAFDGCGWRANSETVKMIAVS